MPYTYIIYSKTLNKYYTGACKGEFVDRIAKHNLSTYGNHRFTSAANDWVLFFSIQVRNYTHAIALERKIKSMKSRIYIQNLKRYPELVRKIIDETEKT